MFLDVSLQKFSGIERIVALPATHLPYSGDKPIVWRCAVARKTDPRRIEEIYRAIHNNPGQRPGMIARLLGVHRSAIIRTLPALESQGYLLSEDEKGRLWPYHRRG
jgi:hypothetical protein